MEKLLLLTQSSGLALPFLYPPLDSWRKGRCCLVPGVRHQYCSCLLSVTFCVTHSDSEETQRSLATAQKIRDLQHENHLLNVLLLKQHTLSKWRLGYHRVNHGKEVCNTASFSAPFHILRPPLVPLGSEILCGSG